MKPNHPFAHHRPFQDAMAWLFIVAVFVAAAVVGIKTDHVLVATLSVMIGHAFVVTGISLCFNFHLQREAARCASDLERLKTVADLNELAPGPQSSLLVKHLHALRSCTRRSDENALLGALACDLYAANASTRHAALVQPALGLLGTCLGLCIMGEHFSSALSSATPTTAMKDALKGLGVAFATTLVGCLCGSLVLSGLAHTAERTIDRLVAQVGAIAELRRQP